MIQTSRQKSETLSVLSVIALLVDRVSLHNSKEESPNSDMIDVCQIKQRSSRWLCGILFLKHMINVIRHIID